MEAVPRMPMISFELKPSCETPSFGPKLKQYIRDFYNEDGESYNTEIRQLESLRAQAVAAQKTVSCCAVLKRYFCQLHFLQSRFPMGSDAAAHVAFSWGGVHGGSAEGDVRFEMAAILHNVAALHTQLGADDARASADGMKMCCTHFQCAAWAFQHLREAFPEPAGTDMSANLLDFMERLCLAQAQECILEKSMMDSRKPTIVAKVAVQVVEYYAQALTKLEQGVDGRAGASVQDIVGAKQFKTWRRYVRFKGCYHDALGLLYHGQQAEEQQKNGERVAFYQAAADKLREAFKLAKGLDQIETVNEGLALRQDVIEGKLKGARNENEFIYHEEVPERSALTLQKGASLVKGIPFGVNDPEIAGPDLFARLVPMAAHQAASLYSEEMAALRRRVGKLVDEKDAELADFVSALRLDQLELHSQSDALPQELVDRCAALNARPGAAEALTDAVAKLAEACSAVDGMLTLAEQLLQREQQEERRHRALVGAEPLGRPPSIAATDLAREAAKYRAAHERAAESNATLRKALAAHLPGLQTLSGPLDELHVSIPSMAVLNSSADQASVAEMRRLAAKVAEMTAQRAALSDTLRAATARDDITAALVTRDPALSMEALFQREMHKHQRVVSTLEQNLAAQANVLAALTEANARYAGTRRAAVEIQRSRENVISSLTAAYDAYQDLLSKSGKGLEFYRKLETNVSKLLQRVKGTCNVQDEERSQLQAGLGAAAAGQPSAAAQPARPKLKDYLGDTGGAGPRLKDYLLQPGEGGEGGQRWPSVRPAPVGQEGSGQACPAGQSQPGPALMHQSHGYDPSKVTPVHQSYGYDPVKATPPHQSYAYASSKATPSDQSYAYDPRNASPAHQSQGYDPPPSYASQFGPASNQSGGLDAAGAMAAMSLSANQGTAQAQWSQGTANTQSGAYGVQAVANPGLAGYPAQTGAGQALAGYAAQTGASVPQTGYASQAQTGYSVQTGVNLTQTGYSNQAQSGYSAQTGASQAQSGYSMQTGAGVPQTGYSSQMQTGYPGQTVAGQVQAGVSTQAGAYAQPAGTQPVGYSDQTGANQSHVATYQGQAGYSTQNSMYPGQLGTQQAQYSGQAGVYQGQTGYPGTYPVQSGAQTAGYSGQTEMFAQSASSYSGQSDVNASQTGLYAASQTGTYPMSQTGTYQANQTSTYPTSQTSTYPTNQTGSYPASQTSTYQANQAGTYPTSQTGSQSTSQTGAYTASQTGAYPANQTGSYQASQTGLQSISQTGAYTANQTDAYTANQTGAYPANQTGTYQASQTGSQSTSQTGAYTANQTGTYPANQTGTYPTNQTDSQSTSQTGTYTQPGVGATTQYGHYANGSYPNAGASYSNANPSYPTGTSYASAGASYSKTGTSYSNPNSYPNTDPLYSNPNTPYSNTAAPYTSSNTAYSNTGTGYATPNAAYSNVVTPYAASNASFSNAGIFYPNAGNEGSAFGNQPSSGTYVSAATTTTAGLPSSSSVDLLAGLDFTVGPLPLTPSNQSLAAGRGANQDAAPVVKGGAPSGVKVEAKVEPPVVKAEDGGGGGAKDVKEGQEGVAKEGVAKEVVAKDPYSEPEALRQLTADVDKLDKFVEGLTARTLNGPTPLDLKWKELQDLQEREGARRSISVARCYPTKNRCADVLPYDDSRVELPGTKDDYINASHVAGLTAEAPAIVATQFPLPSTLTDFWTMIWQQQAELVVCLLGDAELPDAAYWPDSRQAPLEAGDFRAALQSRDVSAHVTRRIVTLSCPLGSRNLVLLQLTSWPGSSFPASPVGLLAVVKDALWLHGQQRGAAHPVVVHCAAGVGRTGLFCLLLAALASLNQGKGVSCPSALAARLSSARRQALRDREHLRFAYQALLYHAQDVLLKRGVLASRPGSFEGKRTRHARHPSDDFVLAASEALPAQPSANTSTADAGEAAAGAEDSAAVPPPTTAASDDPLGSLDPYWRVKRPV